MFRDHSIVMFISRRAAAEQPKDIRASVPEFVPLPRQNGNRISGSHLADFVVNTNSSVAMSDVVNLLGSDVVMLLGARAG
jgi:hypothetical protein